MDEYWFSEIRINTVEIFSRTQYISILHCINDLQVRPQVHDNSTLKFQWISMKLVNRVILHAPKNE